MRSDRDFKLPGVTDVTSLPNRPLTEDEAQQFSESDGVTELRYTPDDSTIISPARGELDGSVKSFWIDRGEEVQRFTWHPSGWRAGMPFFSEDGLDSVPIAAEHEVVLDGSDPDD